MTIDTTKPLEVVNEKTGERFAAQIEFESDAQIRVAFDIFGHVPEWYNTDDGKTFGASHPYHLQNVPEPEVSPMPYTCKHGCERDGYIDELTELRAFKAQALASGYVPHDPDASLIDELVEGCIWETIADMNEAKRVVRAAINSGREIGKAEAEGIPL